jgi:RNA polymerase sigma-70 factor (ECF subfamily)
LGLSLTSSSCPIEVEEAVTLAFQREWAFVLAATVKVTGDIDVAEECVQDAFARAMSVWPQTGIPDRTGAWLTTVARRRAIDVLRQQSSRERILSTMVEPDVTPAPREVDLPVIFDDRLRLIFTCCHPALSIDTQVALTLRLICGLTTEEVSRAFLVSESTMAARLTRGKKKIALSHIPYRVPRPEELPERIDAVLSTVYLVFTTGHTAPSGTDLMRRDLVARSKQLARMLKELLPDDPNVVGLLALITLTDARSETRTNPDGMLLLLSEQNRDDWDLDAIAEGTELTKGAFAHHQAGRYVLMAAIASVHANAPTWEATDWAAIVTHYDILFATWPSPVVALNRAAAIGFALGPVEGLHALDELAGEERLAGYRYLASARANFLRQLGRLDDARLAYLEAVALSDNDVETAFLERQICELDGGRPPSVGAS